MGLSSSVGTSAPEVQLSLLLAGGEMFSEPPPKQKLKRNTIRELLAEQAIDLSFPLFDLVSDVAVLYDNEEADTGIRTETLSFMDNEPYQVGQEAEEQPNWTNDEIIRLHGWLIEESLKALAARGNALQKEEILQWLFEPDIFADREETGGKVILSSEIPWSFAFCCRLSGYDPDTIRDGVTRQIGNVLERIREHYAARKESREAISKAKAGAQFGREALARLKAEAEQRKTMAAVSFFEDVAEELVKIL